jgi:protein SCO1/2
MKSFRVTAVAVVSILLTATAPRAADERMPAMNGNAAHNYFTDVQLVNQDGDTMRLYSDLIDGKIVIINSFFASCSGSCPVMAGNFAQIQKHLGDRLGKDVNLISISVDPTADTPEKLKEYAARFHARPGWYFLTGKKANVDLALRKLGQYVNDKNDHFSIIIIGNQRTGLWKKALGVAKPEDLIPIVDSVLNDKG